MQFDMHTHHKRCGHATGNIRDYIEAAIEQGLVVVGISDHSPFFSSDQDHLYPQIAMVKTDFKPYINEVLSLKEEYKRKIDVLLGIESDFFRSIQNFIRISIICTLLIILLVLFIF